MSLPPRVLCRSGCGDFGDPELEFLCGDCHGDKIEIGKQRELLEYVESKKKTTNSTTGSAKTEAPTALDKAESPRVAPRRRAPAIDHRQAFDAFLARPREKDEQVIVRECMFLEREIHIRDTSKLQLKRFMIATDLEEPVDPKEWGRYQYGAPRDVPRHDVDHATEIAAQIKLFCSWRKRTVARKLVSRKQLAEQQKKTRQKPPKTTTATKTRTNDAMDRTTNEKKKKSSSRLLPSLSSLTKSLSTRVLSIAGNDSNAGAAIDTGVAETAVQVQ